MATDLKGELTMQQLLAEQVTLGLRRSLLSKGATYLSDELWETISVAIATLLNVDGNSPTQTIELYTISPDQTVCQQVWPNPKSKSLDATELFGSALQKVGPIHRVDEALNLLLMRRRKSLVLVARIGQHIPETLLPFFELIATDIADALWDRREAVADRAIDKLRIELQNADTSDRNKLLLKSIRSTLLQGPGLGEYQDSASATLRVLQPDDGNELRLVDTLSEDASNRPSLLTSLPEHLINRVLVEAKTVVVPNALELNGGLNERLTSFVKFPVRTGTNSVIGLVCVGTNELVTFNLGLVHVAQLIVDRIVVGELERVRRLDASVALEDKLRQQIPSANELLSLIEEPADSDGSPCRGFMNRARHKLYSDLTKRAFEMGRAYRTAIGVVDDSGVRQASIICPTPNWPDGMDGKSIPDTVQESGVLECIRTQQPYELQDVSAPNAKYYAVDDKVRSAVYIPILVGNHCLGALAVEWDERTPIDPSLIRGLKDLCAAYGLILNSVGLERHLVLIDSLLKKYRDDLSMAIDFPQLLDLVGEMMGVGEGAILIRNRHNGRFYFKANLVKPEYVDNPAVYYDLKQDTQSSSVTSIVENRPVRHLLDKAKLGQQPKENEAPWLNKFSDNNYKDDLTSFLCVPICNGGVVFGVVRLNASERFRIFDTVDQSNLLSVALRIADCLEYREQLQMNKEKLAAAISLVSVDGDRGWIDVVFQSVQKAIGDCKIYLRIAERKNEVVLVLAGATDRNWLADNTLVRRIGEGISGWLLKNSPIYDDPDVTLANSLSHRANAGDILKKAGSVYAILLKSNNEPVGSLIVCSEFAMRFNSAEKRFIDELGELLSNAIVSLQKRMCQTLSLTLRRNDLTKELLTDRQLPQIKQEICMHVYDSLVTMLKPSRSLLCVREDGVFNILRNSEFETDGRQILLQLSTLDAVSTDEPTMELLNTPHGVFPTNLFRNLERRERQLVVFPLRMDYEQYGFYCLLLDDTNLVHSATISVVAGFLLELQEIFAISDQVRNAEMLLPLMQIGAFASGFQHAARAPLTKVMSCLTRIDSEPDMSAEDRRELLEHLRPLQERLKVLLDYLKPITDVLKTPEGFFSVREAILDAMKLAHIHIGEICTLECGEHTVFGRKLRLTTSIFSLLLNSIEATKNVPNRRISIIVSSDERKLTILIVDNGVGMNETDVQHCLKPGFTTKTNGTGLGLSTAYLALRSMGGRLRIESVYREGTTCRIELPKPSDRSSNGSATKAS